MDAPQARNDRETEKKRTPSSTNGGLHLVKAWEFTTKKRPKTIEYTVFETL